MRGSIPHAANRSKISYRKENGMAHKRRGKIAKGNRRKRALARLKAQRARPTPNRSQDARMDREIAVLTKRVMEGESYYGSGR